MAQLQKKIKRYAVLVGVVIVVYVIIVPMCWSFFEPRVGIAFPDTWQYDNDLQIDVRVRAVHNNFRILQVRMTFDHTYRRADGRALYPSVLYSQPPKSKWSTFKVNRLTYPCTKRVTAILPLAEMAREQGTQPGTISGKVQVEVEYIRGIGRFYSLAGKVRSDTKVVSVPYTVTLE